MFSSFFIQIKLVFCFFLMCFLPKNGGQVSVMIYILLCLILIHKYPPHPRTTAEGQGA